MNCIIVDDERLAREVLENYINKTPDLNLIAMLSNGIELFKFLNQQTHVDLVFLDIKMPEISGLELVRSLKNVPNIIFTTAYHEHALDAFNLNAIDYLLKPFSYDRFLQAVAKSIPKESIISTIKNQDKSFFVKSDKKLINIKVDNILYVEGLKNYYLIVMKDSQSIIVHNTLNYLENALVDFSNILRVHRSYFINLDAIKEIVGNDIVLNNDKEIPISTLYKDKLMSMINMI